MDRSELEALVGELRAAVDAAEQLTVHRDDAVWRPADALWEAATKAADAIEALLQQDMAPSGEGAEAANRERYHLQGIRACVTRLHAMAAGMNDPHAKAILNTAALELGVNKPLPAPPLTPAADCGDGGEG